MGNNKKKTLKYKVTINVALLLLFSVVMLVGTLIMRKQLIKNSENMSLLLLNNYVISEEKKIETYKTMITLGTKFIAEKENQNYKTEEIKSNLYPYLNGFSGLYSYDSVRCYGILNGSLFTNDEELEKINAATYDFYKTEWYQGAMKADGEVYITNTYKDYITGKTIVTISQKVKNSNSMLAFDIFFDQYHAEKRELNLPQNASYYLCDQSGNLIYYESILRNPKDEIQKFVSEIVSDIPKNIEQCKLNNRHDLAGNLRNVFTQRLENGWRIILTFPQENVLGGMKDFYRVIGIVFLFGLVLISYLAIRDYSREKTNQKLWKERQSMAYKTEIYQKTMNSIMLIYHEIYFVDLYNDVCEKVYPKEDGVWKSKEYENFIIPYLINEAEEDESKEKIQSFLSPENIRCELCDKEAAEMRYQHRKPDGTSEACMIILTVAERANGMPVSVILAIRDIENMLKQEEAQQELLLLAAQRAEAANHAKSDFLSNMSHDIRTPMNAILGMTAIAAMNIDNKERVMDALKKISISGKHLLGLINSVLDMSKIESGKINLIEDEFNLSDSIEELLTVFYTQIHAKDLELKVNIGTINNENVIGDEQRLQQIFINILGNAIKFTPKGGLITLSIQEKASHMKDHSCYEFVFEDTGIGMEQDFVDKIFEPFVRVADTRTTRIEGTGLGMSIAVNIARLMGGDIQVESKLGKGSKFTVTVFLKLNQVSQEHINILSGLSVLVVNDEEVACMSACEILNSLDMEAEYELNGDDAVKRVVAAHQAEEDFSVVILDWKMPGKDGIETAKEIRTLVGEDVPIIILSAYDWSEIEAEATLAGVNAFIEKPLFKTRLTHVLKEVLEISEKPEDKSELDYFKKLNYKGKRVLLVEDNELNIEVAEELLTIVGVEVEKALNGQEAVEMLLDKAPRYYNLIFMDIQMPIMNGYDASVAIRHLEREDLREIPIIAMTADAFADDVKKSKEAGMNGHIAKPVDITKLEHTLKEWL